MKHYFDVREINKSVALEMIQKYHYSNTLPKLNKYFLGFYENNVLQGVMTLGWGTRPLHTIKLIFPTLGTQDYLEIGRMCMTDEMERGSESQMIKACIKWLKRNHREVKVLFTWADGMLGKCGYVYQASNFMYIGYSKTDIYIKDGYKIHPRQTRALFRNGEDDKRITVRPTVEQQIKYGIEHYRGRQYKYVRVFCGRVEKKFLMRSALFEVEKPPKDNDLYWEKQNQQNRKWEVCGIPPYKSDFSRGDKVVKKLIETFVG